MMRSGVRSEMKIRTRALLVVMVVVSAITVSALIVAWSVAVQALQRREGIDVKAGLARAGEALNVQIDQLERTSLDWAVWNDMYRFAQDRNAEFASSNLYPEALATIDVDFMVIIDDSGEIIRVIFKDAAESTEPSVPPVVRTTIARRPELATDGDAGILATPEGPLLLTVQPILQIEGGAPRAGTLVMGRYLDVEDTQLFTRVTGVKVSLIEAAAAEVALAARPEWSDQKARREGVVVPTSRFTVFGYRQILGLDGQSGLVIESEQPRTTMIQARETSGYLLAAVAVAGLALVAGVMGSIDQIVTQRLRRLSENVREIARESNFDQRVDAAGSDEISTLGADINSMLGTLQDSQVELEYMAGHDMLTTLFNRRRFEEELERDLLEQTRSGGTGAILWLDIDDFKEVNDTLGHAVGDRLLADFSMLIKDETRAYATLARIGGDEFALILPNADRAEAEKAASRLISLLSTHIFEIDHHRISQEVSIGIALYPDHGVTKDDLLVRADLAMYEAKNSGGNSYRVSGDGSLGERQPYSEA